MRGLEVLSHLFDGCYPGIDSRETPPEIAGDESWRAKQVAELARLTAPYSGVGRFAKVVVVVSV